MRDHIHSILHWIAQIVCVVLYPLLIPTYGMSLFCISFSNTYLVLPIGYCLTICVATLFFTCLLPLTLILYMWKKGQISDLYIHNAEQRTMPYLYSIIGFVAWIIFVYRTMHAPNFLTMSAVGAGIGIGVVMWINRTWKISAHLCGMGGLLGGIICYAMGTGTWPISIIIVLLAISLMLMYARIYLNAHTPTQVVAGYLLGIICTTLPYLLMQYV